MVSEFKLAHEIIKLSNADIWDNAKLEWSLQDVYQDEETQTCLCGHYPIKEICNLLNRENGNIATVGNCCVKKFIGINSDKIFQCWERIKKNISKGLNAETIEYVFKKGWIDKWEHDFSFDTARKRILSEKQEKIRISINKKILYRMGRSSLGLKGKVI